MKNKTDNKSTKNRKRKGAIFAVLLGVAGTGGVLASASSLGLTSSGSLGSGVQVVASCDTNGVDITYNSVYSETTGKYFVNSVDITGIATACAGRSLKITLTKYTTAVPFLAVADGTSSLSEYDAGGVFTGHARINLLNIISTDAADIDSAAIVIA